MAKSFEVKIEDNSKEVLELLKKATEQGLKAVGMAAEDHAVEKLSDVVYVGDKDYPLTGRLRNSLTFALSGQEANKKSYETDVKGEPGGVYDGTAPTDDVKSVYLGTNVVYAEGIELGTHRKAGAVHFIRDAMTEHPDEYKDLLKNSLENA